MWEISIEEMESIKPLIINYAPDVLFFYFSAAQYLDIIVELVYRIEWKLFMLVIATNLAVAFPLKFNM